MKKLYFLCLIFLGLNISAKAQYYTVQGGLNIATTSNDFTIHRFEELVICPHIYIYQVTELTKTFDFLIGLGINTKGTKFNFNWYGEKENTYAYLNYLEMPLLVKFRHPINERYSIFGEFGPSLGFLTSSFYHRVYENSNGEKFRDNNFEFYDDDYNLLELSFNIGIGLEYKSYIFAIRGGLGITKFEKQNSDRNQIFALSFGYKFKTKK
jgi:hypothetical protein